MTPPNWDHVDHEITRRLLNGEVLSFDEILETINFADKCLYDDVDNEDVTDEVYVERSQAYMDACDAFLNADTPVMTEAFRRLWSI